MNEQAVQPLMLMAGIALLCWVMLRNRLLRRQRRIEGLSVPTSLRHNGSAKRQYDQFTGVHSTGAPTEVLQWQVELHDLSRQLQAELDSKMAAVSVLSRQFDAASRRLSDLIEQARGQSAIRTNKSLFERIGQLADKGWEPDKIARFLDVSEDDVRVVLEVASGSSSTASSPPIVPRRA
ncbi:MAG: hypothetical protein KatS3mg111_1242 [Pirellulaceae bacterium]|nr:MAG: hypothetical protein KatS3mg111_1242 [Pirellulaceae bacterium]